MNAEDIVAFFSTLDPKEKVFIGWWRGEDYDIPTQKWDILVDNHNYSLSLWTDPNNVISKFVEEVESGEYDYDGFNPKVMTPMK